MKDGSPKISFRLQPSTFSLGSVAPWQWVLLGCILILAAAVRLNRLGSSCMSYDELATMEIVRGDGLADLKMPRGQMIDPPLPGLVGAKPWWHVWSSQVLDPHPPLYDVLERWWLELAGTSDWAARFPSALAGVAAVYFLFDAVRFISGTTAALWSALLMSLATPQVVLAQDARSYALSVALFTFTVAAAARIDRIGPNRARTIALGAGLLASALTHYLNIFPAAAIALFMLVQTRGRARAAVAKASGVAVALFLILWGPFIPAQNAAVNQWEHEYWYYHDKPAEHVNNTLSRFDELPVRLLAGPIGGWHSNLERCAGVLYLMPLLLWRKRPDLRLWTLCLSASVGAVLVSDLMLGSNRLEIIKYTILAGPPVYAIIGSFVPSAPWHLKHVLPALAAICCGISLPVAYDPNSKPHWSDVAAAVDRFVPPGATLAFAGIGWGNWYTGALMMAVNRYQTHDHRPIVMLDNTPVGPEQLPPLRAAGPIWAVMAWASEKPSDLLPGYESAVVELFPQDATLYVSIPTTKPSTRPSMAPN